MESEPEPAPNYNITVQLVLIAVLILINTFFVCAEMAIASVNKNKIKLLADEGNKKAQLLINLIEEPINFLSTIRAGITFSGFFSSAIAATGIAHVLGEDLTKFNLPYSYELSIVIMVIGLSYVTLVFSELFPKNIAVEKPEAIAMFSVIPIYYLSKIMLPFVKLFLMSTNILIKISGFHKINSYEEIVSKDDLKSLMKVGQEHGVINATEKEMIDSIFKFDDKLAKEVMTPRTEVFLVNINDSVPEFLDRLLEEKYSRVPVYDDDVDNIVGILYMKDFIIEARKNGFDNVNIKSILHSPYFVPESKNIDILFKELQTSKNHIAILIDEYGGFSGVVTIEDLIEEVMGNIEDEYDDDEPDIKKVDSNTYIVRGLLSLDELNNHLDLNLECENYDTIGGFLISRMGRIPQKDEEKIIEYDNVTFKIEEVKEKRIEKVKILINNNLLHEF